MLAIASLTTQCTSEDTLNFIVGLTSPKLMITYHSPNAEVRVENCTVNNEDETFIDLNNNNKYDKPSETLKNGTYQLTNNSSSVNLYGEIQQITLQKQKLKEVLMLNRHIKRLDLSYNALAKAGIGATSKKDGLAIETLNLKANRNLTDFSLPSDPEKNLKNFRELNIQMCPIIDNFDEKVIQQLPSREPTAPGMLRTSLQLTQDQKSQLNNKHWNVEEMSGVENLKYFTKEQYHDIREVDTETDENLYVVRVYNKDKQNFFGIRINKNLNGKVIDLSVKGNQANNTQWFVDDSSGVGKIDSQKDNDIQKGSWMKVTVEKDKKTTFTIVLIMSDKKFTMANFEFSK